MPQNNSAQASMKYLLILGGALVVAAIVLIFVIVAIVAIDEPPLYWCNMGETRECDTGLPGICATGTQTCQPDRNWGDCEHIESAVPEICDDDVDNDCLDEDEVCSDCVDGEIVERCDCGRTTYETGYCCTGSWQATICRSAETNNVDYNKNSGEVKLDSDIANMVEKYDFGSQVNGEGKVIQNKEAWDMVVYNGKLYISLSWDYLQSTPVSEGSGYLYEYDGINPPTLVADFSYERWIGTDKRAGDQGIRNLRIIDDKIYIPGGDDTTNDLKDTFGIDSKGNIYVYDTVTDPDNPSLELKEIPKGGSEHVSDVIKFGGALYATVNMARGSAGRPIIFKSTDDGLNWVIAYIESCEWGILDMIEFHENLYAANGGMLLGVCAPGSGKPNGHPYEKLIKFDGQTWTKIDYDPPEFEDGIGPPYGIPIVGTSYSFDKYHRGSFLDGTYDYPLKGTVDRISRFVVFKDNLYFGTQGDIYKYNENTDKAQSVQAIDKTVWDFAEHKGKLYAVVAERFNSVADGNTNTTHKPDSRGNWRPWYFYRSMMYTDLHMDSQIWMTEEGDNWQMVSEIEEDALLSIASFNGRLYVGTSTDQIPKTDEEHINAKLYIAPYYSDGYFVSVPQSFSENAVYDKLSFTLEEVEDTAVKFQIRTADTEAQLVQNEFVGPDDGQDSYYTISGTEISDSHDGQQWIQYKAYLSTNDTVNKTPVIKSVTISTSQ